MASTLLKLNDSNGNLKEITTTEERYIAYRAAAYLATNFWITSVGATRTGTPTGDAQTVGSYTNSFFNQAVGTHPGTSISSGSTTTTLKQNGGTADYGATTRFRRPVSWDGTADGIKELTDAEMNTIADRILAYMMTNEWAGTNFRLSSSTPSGYSSFQANIFSDTRTDGHNVNYSLFKKTTLPAAPTTVRPMCIKYNGSTFDGLQEMTDDQIGYTFGQWIKTRMVSANDRTGRYLLLPSGQTPANQGYSGTWVSRGTATDTKNVTSEVDYSKTYSANYQRNSTNNFTGDFVGDYVGTVVYSATYSGTYTRNSTTNYQRTSTRTSTGKAYMRFLGRWHTDLTTYGSPRRLDTNEVGRLYVRNAVAYQRGGRAWYSGLPYARNYTRVEYGRTVNYARVTYQRGLFVRGGYVGNYLGDYVGDFAGNYVGDYIGNYTNENVNFSANYTNVFTGDFIGDYVGNYLGNYVGTTISSGTTTVQTYTLYTRTA